MESTTARVIKIERGTIDLVVQRPTRLGVGTTVRLELEESDVSIEGLSVTALCDTKQFRRAEDAPWGGGRGLDLSGAAVWLRCVADTPKARAQLWDLASLCSRASAAGDGDGPDTGLIARPEREQAVRDRLPARGLEGEAARLERLAHLRMRSGKTLRHLEHTRLIADQLRNNIEQLIGSVEVPVGAAGPLLFRGSAARGSLYLPMATTEGALVSSATRGALALTLSGGVHTRVLGQVMHRVPAFLFKDLDQACLFARWIKDHEPELRDQAERVSRHARLVEIEPLVVGRATHVRFVYETGDAAGQNMTTACTWSACQWVLEHLPYLNGLELDFFGVEAGMSTDKKASFASLVRGRGMRVAADCQLDAATLRRVLKVTPEQLVRAYQAGLAGALSAGAMGYNINVANVIAAVFTACGQDIACVHESALGILQIEQTGAGVHASILLPSLIVGTVGGGTQLPQQRDYLDMMGCAGTGGARRLAELIAGYCLALDLSTISAVASGQFAAAHERLGRNRPVAWLRETDFDAAFLEGVLYATRDGAARVKRVEGQRPSIGSSILTNLAASRNTGKFVGFLSRRVELEDPSGQSTVLEALLKVKPLDDEALTVLRATAAMCGEELARAVRRHESALGFAGCHARELAIYRQIDPRFTRHVPVVYGVLEEPAREAYVLVLERLEGLALMDAVDDVAAFTRAHREAIVDGLAQLHSLWLGREQELLGTPWLGASPTAERMARASELWRCLAQHAHEEFADWIDEGARTRWHATIDAVASYWPELERMPRTLIHNDFNPRNFALRDEASGLRLCVYDWELATLGVPQRDLAELCAFTLGPAVERESVAALVERHRKGLEKHAGVRLDAALFQRGFVLSLRDLLVTRIALYAMGHTCYEYRFLPRVFHTLMRLLELFDDELAPSTASRGQAPRLGSTQEGGS